MKSIADELTKRWPLGLCRRNCRYFIVGLSLLIVILHRFDRPITVLATGMTGGVEEFFRLLSRLGEFDWVLVPALAGLLLASIAVPLSRGVAREGARYVRAVFGFVLLGAGLPGLVAAALKRIIGRARPHEWSLEAPLDFRMLNWSSYSYQSFPSGHTTTAFAFAMVVAFLLPRRRTWLPMPLALTALFGFATLIGLSRIVADQHYPTDVAAGAVLGVLGAYAVRNFFHARGWLFVDGGQQDLIVPLTFRSIRAAQVAA